MSSVGASIAVRLIQTYRRLISPLLAPRCRYYPSCSAYAVEALTRHGLLRGLGMSAWRLLRCNPFSPGGVDHVPVRRCLPADSAITPGATSC